MEYFWAGFEKAAATRHEIRVNSAIKKKKNIKITYKKLNGRTVKRMVTPYEVKGNLLIGHDHKRQAVRSYKMDRMKEIKHV